MKKVLSLILALAMCFALVACSSSSSDAGDTTNNTADLSNVTESESSEDSSAEDAVDTSASADADKTVSSSEEETGEGDTGNFHVKIKNAVKATDEDGNPAIVITYEWTNNSEETTNVMSSMYEQAFQDGVEMDVGYVDSEKYDLFSNLTDVRPGTTIDISTAFAMTSDSVVEFEICDYENMIEDHPQKITMNFDPATLEE